MATTSTRIRVNLRAVVGEALAELGACTVDEHGRPLRADVALRRVVDRRHIRRAAQAERQMAKLWLTHHVDGIYADLNLTRPTEDPHQ